MPYRNETAPAGTHPILAKMIDQPVLALSPFLLFLTAGFVWEVGLLVTFAFLYLGAWCTFRHTRCGTPPCGITGPLYLLIALFSALRWIPPFKSSALAWSSWDHLFLVFWLGTTAAFAAQWLGTRDRKDFVWAVGFLVTSLIVYSVH